MNRHALSPVGRESLHDRVYAELRRSLIYGMLNAGEVLRIQDLAVTLQTSTMPVREALERRDAEGSVKALTDDITRSFNLVRNRLDAAEAKEGASHDG